METVRGRDFEHSQMHRRILVPGEADVANLPRLFQALRRNVWNPAPIDRCPMIACRQEDSDSWGGTAVTPWEASLGHLEMRSTPGSTAQRSPRNDRIFASPTPKVIGSAPGGGARSQQVGHPLSDGSPLIEARARIVAKLLIDRKSTRLN